MASIEKRVSSEGKVSYRVKIRLKGYPTQTATFERLTDARNWEKITEAAIKEGRHFKTIEAKKHTAGELIDRYIREVLPSKPKIQKEQKQQLQWWKSKIGSYLLVDVTPALIVEHRNALLVPEAGSETPPRSQSTANRYLAALSHAFSIAVKEWCWLDSNPLSKVSKYKEPRGRVRFLSDEERNKLLDVCKKSSNRYLYPIVMLALSTGARHAEILNLKWKDIDLDRRTIILHETKNGERRVLPIANHIHNMLIEHKKVRHLHSDYVFPNERGNKPIAMRIQWNQAVKEAGLEDFRFHDLRHTCASYLAMNGASLAEIAEVLGHKTLQMVKRYAHLSEAHTASVVERMNQKIFG